MPYTPWPAILRSLLSGCRIHGNIEFGEWTAKKLVPENDVPYVLLSKFLARSDEAELDGPHPTSGVSTKRAVAKGNDQPSSTCKESGTGQTKLTGGTNNAKFAPENPYAPLLSAKCY
ncbi:hypothetical protein CerSpe_006840 [Prunus speciosa]